MARFRKLKEIETVASNTQGCCFDADFIYITEASEIMKYTHEGVFVDRHDTVGDGSNDHLGDLCIKDGKLYVKSSLYPTTPYNEIVMRYDAATLTYETEFSTFGAGNDHIGEGIDFRHGHFWTVSDNYDEVYKWEEGFTNPTTYTITEPTFSGSSHHLQTIVWLDDETIAMQLHGGPSPARPQGVLIYKYKDSNRFIFEKIIPVPAPQIIYGQGMAYDEATKTVYFANRVEDAPDKVTLAKLINYPEGVAFSSEFDIDKIIYYHSTTLEKSGLDNSSKSWSHTPTDPGITFPTYAVGIFSIDDGATWNDCRGGIGTAILAFDAGLIEPSVSMAIGTQSDGTVRYYVQNHVEINGGNDYEILLKYVLLLADDDSHDIEGVSHTNISLSSKYSYPKIEEEGTSGSDHGTVAHGLNKLPFVRIYIDDGTNLAPPVWTQLDDGGDGDDDVITIDEDNLYLNTTETASGTLHYRIYDDI